jgi:hypothetical protein
MGNRCSSGSNQSSKQQIIAHSPRPHSNRKKKNFFVQLFAKSRLDATALAHAVPPPVGLSPINQKHVFARIIKLKTPETPINHNQNSPNMSIGGEQLFRTWN